MLATTTGRVTATLQIYHSQAASYSTATASGLARLQRTAAQPPHSGCVRVCRCVGTQRRRGFKANRAHAKCCGLCVRV